MKIDDLFKQNLGNDESNVPDELWERLSANLDKGNIEPEMTNRGNDASVEGMTKSMSFFGKTIIGITSVALAGGGAYLLLSEDEIQTEKTVLTNPKIEIKNENTLFIETKSEPVDAPTPIKETKVPILDSAIAEPIFIEPKTDSVIPIIHSAPAISENIVNEYKKENDIPQKQEPVITNEKSENFEPITENFVWEEEKQEISIEIKIPNMMSPNGDGINDYFKIINLENYPDNTLTILDRRGKVVMSCSNYQNDWGAYELPNGVYLYRLTVKHLSIVKKFDGTITIIR